MAAHLHLVIEPAQELELAVGRQRREVAGPVQPRRRIARERVGHEPLGGQLRPVQVAPGDALAADEELARHPDRHRLHRRIEHVAAGVGDRPADRHRRRRPVTIRRRRAARWPRRSSRSARNVPQRRDSVRAGCASRSGGIASPPYSAVSPGSPAQPASISIRQVAGVACIIVDAEARSSAASAAGSSVVSRSAITSWAPCSSGRNSSSTDGSNDSVVTASTTSSAPIPARAAMACRKFTTLRCSTCDALRTARRARRVDHVGAGRRCRRRTPGSSATRSAISSPRLRRAARRVGARTPAPAGASVARGVITTGAPCPRA